MAFFWVVIVDVVAAVLSTEPARSLSSHVTCSLAEEMVDEPEGSAGEVLGDIQDGEDEEDATKSNDTASDDEVWWERISSSLQRPNLSVEMCVLHTHCSSSVILTKASVFVSVCPMFVR